MMYTMLLGSSIYILDLPLLTHGLHFITMHALLFSTHDSGGKFLNHTKEHNKKVSFLYHVFGQNRSKK